jgi:uncharacterized protein
LTARDGGYVPGRHKIDDYGGGGFRFADMSHRGSILALPSGVRAVPLASAADIDEAMIDRALSESGGLDVFVVGTGPKACAPGCAQPASVARRWRPEPPCARIICSSARIAESARC